MAACPADLFGKNPGGHKSIETYSMHAAEYDKWFDGDFSALFNAEFSSVQSALTALFAEKEFNLLEIGIGTGRFAGHVKKCMPKSRIHGLEPAAGMAQICRATFQSISESVTVIEQKAEDLESDMFNGTSMDCVMMVTTLGFLGDHQLALSKIKGVLAPQGVVCVAFINGETSWGQEYLQVTKADKFYQHGTCILNASDVIALFGNAGFNLVDSACFQTLVNHDQKSLDFAALLDKANPALSVIPGHGQGMWTVLTFQ